MSVGFVLGQFAKRPYGYLMTITTGISEVAMVRFLDDPFQQRRLLQCAVQFQIRLLDFCRLHS